MMKSVPWFGMGGRISSSRRLAAVTEESASSSTGPSSSSKRQQLTSKNRTTSLSSLLARGGSGGGNDSKQSDPKNDSASTMSSHDDVLELYRGEIDDLRRQLREAQEARVKEEEKEMQIVELRRQLDEARCESGAKDMVAAPGSSSGEQQPRKEQQQHRTEHEVEAVASAIRYLDEVIQRVSKSSAKPSRKQGTDTTPAGKGNASNDVDVDATPVKTNKKLVQLEFCPTLSQGPPLGGSKRAVTPPPALAASDGDAEEHDEADDSGSWHAAGVIKLMTDEMTASIAGSSSLHTAADGMSSMHTAAGTSTAHSTSDADASSWLPVGRMAAALLASAADDSTVNTTSNDNWMTAADDDLDDMQTCISALTSHTGSGSRSKGGASSRTTGTGAASIATTTRGDNSAVVVAELYRIQSLLQSVLRETEGGASGGGVGADDDNKNRPCIQRASSKAKKIATLWEKHLGKEDEEKSEKTVTTTKPDKVEAAPLTKESAEQIITSLAALF